MATRRVVTGRDARGKSVLVDDENLDVITSGAMPGAGFVPLWWSDSTPALPLDGKEPSYTSFFPPAGGIRTGVITIPPEDGPTDDSAPEPTDSGPEAPESPESPMLKGFLDVFEPDGAGMHTTASVDVDFVLSGSLVMELDDGVQVQLESGDVVVQNGTRHRWRNLGAVPAVMIYFVFGATDSAAPAG